MFRFFGTIPYKLLHHQNVLDRHEYIRCRKLTVVIMATLTIYWIGFIFAFLQGQQNTDLMSRIVNYLQMTIDSIAMTTIFVSALKNISIFNEIAQIFDVINQNLENFQTDDKYFCKEGSFSLRILMQTMIYLLSYQILNYTLQIQGLYQPIWYFVIINTPMIFYTLSMVSAFLIIYFLKNRCFALRDIIMKFNRDRIDVDDDEQNVKNQIQNYLNILNNLMKLSNKIDEYFGPMLLTSLSTIFIIASVQSYYIYWTILNIYQYDGFNERALIREVLSCVTCFILLFGITNICEQLSIAMRAITSNLSKTISRNNKIIEVSTHLVSFNYFIKLNNIIVLEKHRMVSDYN